jgi:hypothetical protein
MAATMTADDVEGMMARIATVMSARLTQALKISKDESTEAAAAAAAAASTPKIDNEYKYRDAKLNEKSYKRMEKFSGGEAEWQEWKYDFEVITRSTNHEVGTALGLCLLVKEPKTGIELQTVLENQPWRPTLRSAELYDLLIMLTAGEAKALIKTATVDGFVAWHTLNKAYSRDTLARTLRCYREASNPEPARSLSEVVSKIAAWESKVAALQKVNGMKALDPMLKLAALTEICTPDLKDLIFQQVEDFQPGDDDALDVAFKKIKEKIISWTSNRLSASRSVEMNIGNVGNVDGNWCQPCEQDCQE